MSAPSNALMSFAKLIAQRTNAQRSTGPRTEAGKSRSRGNALRHSGWAGGRCWTDDAVHAIHEDPEDFQRLRESLRKSWGDPDNGIRNALIEHLARLYWRRERMEHA
jgi:hypothetical protein